MTQGHLELPVARRSPQMTPTSPPGLPLTWSMALLCALLSGCGSAHREEGEGAEASLGGSQPADPPPGGSDGSTGGSAVGGGTGDGGSAGPAKPSNGSGGKFDSVVVNAPCAGCVIVSGSSSEQPMPLVVALHGDEGEPSTVVNVWGGVTRRHGAILLAPACPAAAGCAGSWWQWGGDFGWLDQQIAAVTQSYNIDLNRVYLTAWSGGATYSAFYVNARADQLAAANLNAGGNSPGDACAECKIPVSFVVGDNDQLRPLVDAAHSYYETCGYPSETVVLADTGHNLAPFLSSGGAESIMQWFLQFQSACGGWNPVNHP